MTNCEKDTRTITIICISDNKIIGIDNYDYKKLSQSLTYRINSLIETCQGGNYNPLEPNRAQIE